MQSDVARHAAGQASVIYTSSLIAAKQIFAMHFPFSGGTRTQIVDVPAPGAEHKTRSALQSGESDVAGIPIVEEGLGIMEMMGLAGIGVGVLRS
jgi:hypothetical protein